MSDEELSLKIAEYLEPRPDAAGMAASKCWVMPHYSYPVKSYPLDKLQPRDMVNDPAMTVMLMKRKDFVGVDYMADDDSTYFYSVVFCPNTEHSLDCFPLRTDAAELGRAVAEAFAKAKELM